MADAAPAPQALQPSRHAPHEPAPGSLSAWWKTLRRGVARAIEAAARRWLWVVAALALALLAGLGAWGERLAPGANPTAECTRAALRFDEHAAQAQCRAALTRIVAAAPPRAASTCAPDGLNTSLVCAFQEPGQPRLFIWADNLFVGLYTLFFLGCMSVAYGRLRTPQQPAPRRLWLLLVLSVASGLTGAITDHGENFWLLAHIGEPLQGQDDDVAKVVLMSVWKFRLFALNLALALLWLAWAQYRRHVPCTVLFKWPRLLWDTQSARWFDRHSVQLPAPAPVAFDLIGLCGAPRDATLTVQREDNTLSLSVEAPVLAMPHVLTVCLDAAGQRAELVSLACPDLKADARDQGLAERMVLATCCAAWRLGVPVLYSLVNASSDDAVNRQNRRWVNMALDLGWDAELPAEARQTLPPGLRHLRSLSALMNYPDGRAWWRTARLTLRLRFVTDAERAQAGAKHPDADQMARDRLCLVRLQAYAARNGIRLAL